MIQELPTPSRQKLAMSFNFNFTYRCTKRVIPDGTLAPPSVRPTDLRHYSLVSGWRGVERHDSIDLRVVEKCPMPVHLMRMPTSSRHWE